MSEKETIKQLQDLISDFNLSDGFDIRVNATDVKALQTVLQLLEQKNNRIDELEKALVDENLKYRDKIKQLKDKIKKDIDKLSNNKNEVFMTQSSQIDASLISYGKELLNILEE